jgi:hypothetical protein
MDPMKTAIPAAFTLVPLAAIAIGVSACATNPPLPQSLQPAAHESFAMVMPARGVQVYKCRAGAGGHEWAFVAPDAELLDARGNVIGTHGAGPFWQVADGSRVSATVKAKEPAPGAAIPWLLLAARSTGTQGTLSQVTSIQRVNTVGGLAPATPCTNEIAGKEERVRYTADYRFFTTR